MPSAPAFWWRPPGLAAALLAPVATVWGTVAARRMRRGGAVAPVPVVCIGNFVVGGAGKTPTALSVAALAAARGHRPVFLTRGYGGRLAGPVLVGAEHGPAEVGDEALLLARAAPTVVARDRAGALPLLGQLKPSLVVMDDGFQNPAIEKTLSLVVVDAGQGVGNGRVMPAGPLRAPLGVQLAHADALVLVGAASADGAAVAALAQAEGVPVFGARLVARAPEALRGRPLLAFAGIGRPEKFFDQLRREGLDVRRTEAFADHRPYGEADAARLLADAAAEGLDLVTTEKDLARLAGADGARGGLRDASAVLAVDLVFDAPDAVAALLPPVA
ncbi:tetraacyldisaccharide 4'-kinase [Methylobrevis albus]|uniref:Tetraacyldisaccharide 4'-kinase n=1 Tax=Methylobrevis albus TaxID=2793297 RepID=A0A931MYE2_9HYPH|nr:tetraacyldisaccharide 4'-kinase [Methylobrevis albus]MBH0236964.1 tetraacyldisaccharide 4'-kinase [Methylobrevis albus]